MTQVRKARLLGVFGLRDELPIARTGLVRVPIGADSSLFGGWGVRI